MPNLLTTTKILLKPSNLEPVDVGGLAPSYKMMTRMPMMMVLTASR